MGQRLAPFTDAQRQWAAMELVLRALEDAALAAGCATAGACRSAREKRRATIGVPRTRLRVLLNRALREARPDHE